MKNLPYSLLGYLSSFLCLRTMISSAQDHAFASKVAEHSDISAYCVSNIQSDPVLGKKWAILINHEHSEWPVVALPIDNSAPFHWPQCPQWASSPDTQSKPMVHIGEVIRAWKHENLLRIEVAGVAEEDIRAEEFYGYEEPRELSPPMMLRIESPRIWVRASKGILCPQDLFQISRTGGG